MAQRKAKHSMLDVFKLEMPHRALRLINCIAFVIFNNWVFKLEMPHRALRPIIFGRKNPNIGLYLNWKCPIGH